MSSVYGVKAVIPPAQQADAAINQANPVSATLYTVLDTTPNVRILSITARVDWTVQPTPLEVVITIDGNTIIHSVGNPVTATDYTCTKNVAGMAATAALQSLLSALSATSWLAEYEGRSVRVQVRTTGGTVQALIARVKYARW